MGAVGKFEKGLVAQVVFHFMTMSLGINVQPKRSKTQP